MCPGYIETIKEFPFTPTGKIDRKILETKDIPQIANRITTENVAISEIENIVLDIWKSLLDVDTLGVNEDFFNVGGDSLCAVQACDLLEQRLGKKVGLVTIFQTRTVRSLAAELESEDRDNGPTELIIPLKNVNKGGGAHLFCVCGIYLYEPLARLISNKHSVSGIFLPIEEVILRKNKELPSLEEMASFYGAALQKVQPRGPYYLAGLSFGGLLAYELARQLTAAGERVELLAMFDAMLPNTVSWYDRAKAHCKIGVKNGPRYFIDRAINGFTHRLHYKTVKPEFVDRKLEGGVRDMAILRNQAYDRAANAYRKKMPQYDCSALFFRAAERTEFRDLTDGPDCGWRKYIKGEFEAHEVPGDHLNMLQFPHVQAVATVLNKKLDRLFEAM
jgi:aspartate racemase